MVMLNGPPSLPVTVTLPAKAGIVFKLSWTSPAVGSEALLSNGNYHWQAGFINNNEAQTFETTPSGTEVYKEQVDRLTYRAFRIANFYEPQ